MFVSAVPFAEFPKLASELYQPFLSLTKEDQDEQLLEWKNVLLENNVSLSTLDNDNAAYIQWMNKYMAQQQHLVSSHTGLDRIGAHAFPR